MEDLIGTTTANASPTKKTTSKCKRTVAASNKRKQQQQQASRSEPHPKGPCGHGGNRIGLSRPPPHSGWTRSPGTPLATPRVSSPCCGGNHRAAGKSCATNSEAPSPSCGQRDIRSHPRRTETKPIESFHQQRLPPDLVEEIEEWVLNKFTPSMSGCCAAPNGNPAKPVNECKQPLRHQFSEEAGNSGTTSTWCGHACGCKSSHLTSGIHHTQFKIHKFCDKLNSIRRKLEEHVSSALQRRNLSKVAKFNHAECKVHAKGNNELNWHNNLFHMDDTLKQSPRDTASEESVIVSVSMGATRALRIQMHEKTTKKGMWRAVRAGPNKKFLMTHGSCVCFVNDDERPSRMDDGKLQKTKHCAECKSNDGGDEASFALVLRQTEEDAAMLISNDCAIHNSKREGKKAKQLEKAIELSTECIHQVLAKHRKVFRGGTHKSHKGHSKSFSRPVTVRVVRAGISAKLWSKSKRDLKKGKKGKILEAAPAGCVLVELKRNKFCKRVCEMKPAALGAPFEVTAKFLLGADEKA